MREECGIFGITAIDNASLHVRLGLFELQHRGQESCGIATSHDSRLHCKTRMGLVMNSLTDEVLAKLPGNLAIGHTRYSTAGGTGIQNAQPFLAMTKYGQLAIAHNGNLTNADQLKPQLIANGAIFQSTSDTEVVLHLIAQSSKKSLIGAIKEAMRKIRGAYCLLFLTKNSVLAVRDPRGIRPLVIGKLPERGYVFASEKCALRHSNAEFIGDVKHGEIVIATKNSLKRHRFSKSGTPSHPCVFEKVYFARPHYTERFNSGVRLAKEYSHIEADIVIGVPDSGNIAALGFAEASGIRYGIGLTRSHYTGRSFIEPTQAKRGTAVELKLSPVEEVIRGNRVIVVDDSLVRGTTSKKIIRMLRKAGAIAVYFLLASPQIKHPCYDGVDIPDRSQLIAVGRTNEEIAKEIEADGVGYLSLQGLLQACGESETVQHCTGCLDNRRFSEELIQIAT